MKNRLGTLYIRGLVVAITVTALVAAAAGPNNWN